jgi:hypothetical protein
MNVGGSEPVPHIRHDTQATRPTLPVRPIWLLLPFFATPILLFGHSVDTQLAIRQFLMIFTFIPFYIINTAP